MTVVRRAADIASTCLRRRHVGKFVGAAEVVHFGVECSTAVGRAIGVCRVARKQVAYFVARCGVVLVLHVRSDVGGKEVHHGVSVGAQIQVVATCFQFVSAKTVVVAVISVI